MSKVDGQNLEPNINDKIIIIIIIVVVIDVMPIIILFSNVHSF